ncbi:MAG: YceI family protein [Williamsia sp.]|nr:YceI family protein [Williamsia sp.]
MKRTKIIWVLVCILSVQSVAAQKYFTKSGNITFYSKAPLENIEARNTKGVSVFDQASGRIEFSVLLKGFEFEKAKMQEHFNENYVESDKYPKAVFTGNIKDGTNLKLDKDGNYTVEVNGTLTMHGVTKPQNAQATFTVKGGTISAVSEFTVLLADYNIQIPSLVADKVSKNVRVVINVPAYQPMSGS